MKEEFTRPAWKDFSQRYLGTFGWFERPDKAPLMVKVSSVESNQLAFTDKTKATYYANPDQGNVFSFLPVERGVHQLSNGDIVFIRRQAVKQFRRGICEDNTRALSLVKMDILSITFELLEEVFTAPKDVVLNTKGNFVMDKMFSVVNNHIYLYDVVVGVRAGATLVLSSTLFLQELSDSVRRNNVPLEVVVK